MGEGPVRRNNSRVELAVLESDETETELRTDVNSTTGSGLHKRSGEMDANHGREMETNRAHAESDNPEGSREEYNGRGWVWALLRGCSSVCMAPAAWRAFVLIHDDELWLRFCLSGLVIASLLWNSVVFVVPQVPTRYTKSRTCTRARACRSHTLHLLATFAQLRKHNNLTATMTPSKVSRKRFSDFFVVCLSTLDGAAMMGSSMAVITLGG